VSRDRAWAAGFRHVVLCDGHVVLCDGTLWQRLRCQRRQAHSAATDGAGYITPGLALLPTWLGLSGRPDKCALLVKEFGYDAVAEANCCCSSAARAARR
jgi:hypothetical protein